MPGMAVADDALADFDVEAEFAKELAALSHDWLPQADNASNSCSSSTTGRGTRSMPNQASRTGSSTAQELGGKQDWAH